MITSLPNLLTLSRILVIPALVASFYLPGKSANWLAMLLFVAAGITDFLDGWVARRRGEVSSFGRFLDPVADKLLVAAALLMLVHVQRIDGLSILPALVILCREILVAGLREFLAELNVRVPVTRAAKWKTAVQIVALAFLLLGNAGPKALHAHEVGIVGLWAAAMLTIYTGYDYMRAARRYFTGEPPPIHRGTSDAPLGKPAGDRPHG